MGKFLSLAVISELDMKALNEAEMEWGCISSI